MLDFLLKDEKQLLKKEYTLRVATIGLLLSFIFFLICIFFLLPSYFLSRVKEEVAISRAEPILSSDDIRKSKDLEASLLGTKTSLSVLKPADTLATPPVEIIDIALQRPSGIKVDSLSYKEASGTGSLSIVGRAANRDAIVSYVKMLQGQRFFSKVDFPISNLASEKNINFTINATGTF